MMYENDGEREREKGKKTCFPSLPLIFNTVQIPIHLIKESFGTLWFFRDQTKLPKGIIDRVTIVHRCFHI
jgi:hypothetical protein